MPLCAHIARQPRTECLPSVRLAETARQLSLEFKKVARDDAQVESCKYRFLRFSLEQEAGQAQNACGQDVGSGQRSWDGIAATLLLKVPTIRI